MRKVDQAHPGHCEGEAVEAADLLVLQYDVLDAWKLPILLLYT